MLSYSYTNSSNTNLSIHRRHSPAFAGILINHYLAVLTILILSVNFKSGDF